MIAICLNNDPVRFHAITWFIPIAVFLGQFVAAYFHNNTDYIGTDTAKYSMLSFVVFDAVILIYLIIKTSEIINYWGLEDAIQYNKLSNIGLWSGWIAIITCIAAPSSTISSYRVFNSSAGIERAKILKWINEHPNRRLEVIAHMKELQKGIGWSGFSGKKKTKEFAAKLTEYHQLLEVQSPREKYMFCPECGSRLLDRTAYCQSCGKQIIFQ